MFSNIDIDLAEIPVLTADTFNTLDLKYRLVLMINAGIFSLFLIAAYIGFYFLANDNEISFLLIPVLAFFLFLIVFSLYIAYAGFNKKAYKLRQKDLIFKTGLWWRSETSVPFNRVQHSEVLQGPIDRMFNLSKLKIYTAGGHTSDLSIPGLTPEQAQYLKDFITNRISFEEEEEEV